MRTCTWAAAVPATLLTTAAFQKPTTSASWSWRCGLSAEETGWLFSPTDVCCRWSALIKTAFITEQRHEAARSCIDNVLIVYQKQTAGFIIVIICCGLWSTEKGWKLTFPERALMVDCFLIVDSFLWVWPTWTMLKREELNCYETGFFESSFLNGVGYKSQRTHFALNVNLQLRYFFLIWTQRCDYTPNESLCFRVTVDFMLEVQKHTLVLL